MNSGELQSGEWTGFYTYTGSKQKHRMDLVLEFEGGCINGEGLDDVGAFIITGGLDSSTMECTWRKEYVGMHTVFYEGYGETTGIWGTWRLAFDTGGFHIWPVSWQNGVAESEVEEEPMADVEFEPVLVQ